MKRQRFSHVIEKVYHRPWFITPGGYKSVRQVVDARIARAEMPDLSEMAGCEREEMEIDENGIAHISVEGTTCIINHIYVDQMARQIGIGAGLIAEFARIAKSRGCITLDALALPGDRKMKNLYERVGMPARLLIASKNL
jgi:GNAT superfamily N-acetyltransferase